MFKNGFRGSLWSLHLFEISCDTDNDALWLLETFMFENLSTEKHCDCLLCIRIIIYSYLILYSIVVIIVLSRTLTHQICCNLSHLCRTHVIGDMSP